VLGTAGGTLEARVYTALRHYDPAFVRRVWLRIDGELERLVAEMVEAEVAANFEAAQRRPAQARRNGGRKRRRAAADVEGPRA
jgi:hypothetical protein